MSSDKERRAVAARMREILRDDPHGWLDMMVAKAVVDVMGEGMTIGETLADLIDRPTCKKLKNDQHRYWRCSRCGAFVRWDAVTDSTGVRPASYCPNCGAEVVE